MAFEIATLSDNGAFWSTYRLPFIAMLCVQLLGVILLTNVCLLKADYLFQYQVEHYFNTAHTRSDGFCCDADCSNECDNRFLFCLRPIGLSQSSEECPLGNYSTGVIANDSSVFAAGEDLPVGVPNPLVFHGAGAWPGQVEMYIRVDDEDDPITGNSDLVTRFYIEISATVGSEFTRTQENGENSVGLLGASYRVSCTEDFYSPDCSVFCLARDDAQGHYTCDSQGNRVCLDGFEDPASNCTQPCTLAEGCSPIGGYCNVSGTCICRNDYSGDSCSIDLDPCVQPCQNGGTCTTTGPGQFECQCVEGYEGVNCELMVTNECEPNPCQNGGTCMDLLLDYECQCAAGYEGRDCGEEINECDPDPCLNEGNCTDLLADFCCSCGSDFTGRNCEEREEDPGLDTQTSAVIGGAVAAGILLVAIVVLVVVLILVLRWQGQGKVAITAQHAKPIATEVFRAENPTYAGDISMQSLSGGDMNTGGSGDHQFRNPLYGSAEVEEGSSSKSGVQGSYPPPVAPPLAAYYSTVVNSPPAEPRPHDPAPSGATPLRPHPPVEPFPYNPVEGSKIPAKKHQYDSVEVREAEHIYDHAEGLDGERQMYNWLEVSPPAQVDPTYHCDGVEGRKETSEKEVEGVAGSV